MVKKMKKAHAGQVTLELALAIICVIILFWASAKFFFWINKSMVTREQNYESSPTDGRAKAGTWGNKEIQVNEKPLRLNFWGTD